MAIINHDGRSDDKAPITKLDKGGVFLVEVVKVELMQSTKNPDWAPSLRWLVRVLEAPYFRAFASGFTPQTWRKDKPLDKWLNAVGVTSENTPQLDTDALRNRTCLAAIDIKSNGFAEVKALYAASENDLSRLAPEAKADREKWANKRQDAPAPVAPAPVAAVTGAIAAPAAVAPKAAIQPDDNIPF